MRYGFIYLLCVLVLLMLALRFFLPFFIYLIPVFIIIWIIRTVFGTKRHRQSSGQQEQTYYDTSYHNESSDPNVIDVDYKVVDEEDNNQ